MTLALSLLLSLLPRSRVLALALKCPHAPPRRCTSALNMCVEQHSVLHSRLRVCMCAREYARAQAEHSRKHHARTHSLRTHARSHASVLACLHACTSAPQRRAIMRAAVFDIVSVSDASFHEFDDGRAWEPSTSSSVATSNRAVNMGA